MLKMKIIKYLNVNVGIHKYFTTIEETMTEKLVGANNVKTKLLKQIALKRKLNYSHKFKTI